MASFLRRMDYRSDEMFKPMLEIERPFSDLTANRVRFLLGLYHYFSRNGFFSLILQEVLNFLLLEFLSGLFFGALFLWKNTFYWIPYTVILVVHIAVFIFTSLLEIESAWKYSRYLRFHRLTGRTWIATLTAVRDLEYPGLSESDLNNIIYSRINLINKLFDLGILSRFYTRVLNWEMSVALINPIMSDIQEQFSLRIPEYRRRMIILGIVFLILSPVILAIVLLYGVLKYGVSIRYYPKLMELRDWTFLAKIKCRKEGEPLWETTERLRSISRLVDKYQELSRSTVLVLFARFLSYLISAPLLGLFGWTILKPEVLLRYSDLLWIMGLMGSAVGLLQSLIPRGGKKTDSADLETKISEHIPRVSEIGYYYNYRPIIFVLEIVSVFLTPLLLIFYFPSRLENLSRTSTAELSTITQESSLLSP